MALDDNTPETNENSEHNKKKQSRTKPTRSLTRNIKPQYVDL